MCISYRSFQFIQRPGTMLQSENEVLGPIHSFMFIFLIISSISGCGILSSDGNPSLKIETEQNTYDLPEDEYINVEILNTSNQTIYYSTCLVIELEILDAGELVDTIPFGVCECICPAILKPGEQVDPDVSRVFIGTLNDKSDQILAKESVTYRLKDAFYKDKAWGDKLLPDNELRSNEFNLSLPD